MYTHTYVCLVQIISRKRDPVQCAFNSLPEPDRLQCAFAQTGLGVDAPNPDSMHVESGLSV